MDDSAIDRAIDETARVMTAGEPGGAFRAQVMERLAERPSSRRRIWILVPAMSAAVIVMAVLLGRPTVPSAPTTALPSARVEIPGLPGRALPLVASMPARMAAPDIRREAVQPAVSPAGASPLAALAPPPLSVPSLALTAMGPGESIHVQELETIAPITVAPIGEPQGERP